MKNVESRHQHHIGMFDSGIGGLTVLRAIQEKLPYEKIIYFGDTARLPYGDKSAETILRFSIENAVFLMEHNIKMLVVPCNTASSVSIDKLRKIFNIPVVGVIEPGAEKAVAVTRHGRIAVLATRGTILSGAYQAHLKNLRPDVQVTAIPCPLLVPLIEEGMQAHPAMKLILEEYLLPLRQNPVDTLLLGCTHYPALRPLIQELLGPDVQIVDSATTCAEQVAELLNKLSLKSQRQETALHQFFVSDNPEKFRKLGQQFISSPLPPVQLKQNYHA